VSRAKKAKTNRLAIIGVDVIKSAIFDRLAPWQHDPVPSQKKVIGSSIAPRTPASIDGGTTDKKIILFPRGISAAGSRLARGGETNRCVKRRMNNKHRSDLDVVSRSITIMFYMTVVISLNAHASSLSPSTSSHLLSHEGTAGLTRS
jgi:hypothetical protein